jgi:hypothetical protein
MDAFHGYDNLLGLFVGNEIIAINNQSLAAPFIKSAARDLKAYRDSKNYRKIPVGYSATDIAELRPWLQDYLTCGGNISENIDFCMSFESFLFLVTPLIQLSAGMLLPCNQPLPLIAFIDH